MRLFASSLLATSLAINRAQRSTNLQLRLVPRTNALDLIVGITASNGPFFIYRGADLSTINQQTGKEQTR